MKLMPPTATAVELQDNPTERSKINLIQLSKDDVYISHIRQFIKRPVIPKDTTGSQLNSLEEVVGGMLLLPPFFALEITK